VTPARRGERGSTMIEVMTATSILIIAALGFGGTSQYAATSTGIGHRRTAAAMLRAELIDRLEVLPRTTLRGIAAANESTWLVDRCYDVDAQLQPGGENTGHSPTFTCPAKTFYKSWINVTDNGTDAWAATTNSWQIGAYVERVDLGCTPAFRAASVACVSADLLLTD
jgi:Tfp pilus assembly protein PilV